MDQRTPEWFAARTGKVTASRIADVMARTKTGWSASRANYAAQLVVELLTGQREESFTNAAMQWGTDTEPFARDAYSALVGELVEEVGFLIHPRIEQAGASPDGLVGADGMVEIKCPNTATHIETLLSSDVPMKYVYQMQWQMACADRGWCDFVSFDPRMPEALRLHVVRVWRSDGVLAEIEAEVVKFIAEVNDKVQQLMQRASKEATA
jgi:putative phage-type endonuclease